MEDFSPAAGRPETIESLYDEALLAPWTVEMTVEAERRGYNAVLTGCVGDPGVEAAREMVRIPVIGRNVELPYIAASVALDGADISIYALIQECTPEAARMGMRVEAVWKPDGDRRGDHEDILYFRPTGEPDEPLESFIHRL